MAKNNGINDFTSGLIDALNKQHGGGEKVAYNLEYDDAPTKVHRWISTGIKQLDFIIANQSNGGLPEGRIIEIFGPPSIGKSHIAIQIAKSTQQMGGLVVYIDSENATSVDNLKLLGVDISNKGACGFIYLDAVCTEKVFALVEDVIKMTRSLQEKKDVPVTIIWDSVAASSPKAEILADFDKDSIGLQARALAKGFRKITNTIGHNKVTFICINQAKTNIGQLFGDNQVPPGGKAIPYHASVRIKLGAGRAIENSHKEAIGIHVNAKTIKNKISPPFRKCEFQIHFGVGIKEHEELFDFLRPLGPATVNVKGEDVTVEVAGTAAWKTFTVNDTKTGKQLLEKKFTKAKFDEILNDELYSPYLDKLIEAHMVRKMANVEHVDIDDDSLVEIQALADEMGSSIAPDA